MDKDTCDWDEWLEGLINYHSRMLESCTKSLEDYKNGDYWYEINCMPAYNDQPNHTAIFITGNKNLNESIERAKSKFNEVYNDSRPMSMMFDNFLCFKNGHKIKVSELGEEYDD